MPKWWDYFPCCQTNYFLSELFRSILFLFLLFRTLVRSLPGISSPSRWLSSNMFVLAPGCSASWNAFNFQSPIQTLAHPTGAISVWKAEPSAQQAPPKNSRSSHHPTSKHIVELCVLRVSEATYVDEDNVCNVAFWGMFNLCGNLRIDLLGRNMFLYHLGIGLFRWECECFS